MLLSSWIGRYFISPGVYMVSFAMVHPVAFQQLPASPVLDSWLPRNNPEQNGHPSDIVEGESLIPRTCIQGLFLFYQNFSSGYKANFSHRSFNP